MDYQTFRTDQKVAGAIRLLVESLGQFTNPAGERMFPPGAGNAMNAQLQTVLTNAGIKIRAQNEDPQFDFELRGVDLRVVRQRCHDHRINFMNILKGRGNKLYYDTRILNNPPNMNEGEEDWDECARPEASELSQELSELIFMDQANHVVDWESSLNNLKRLARDRFYNEPMMQACLVRLVSKYLPEQYQLLKTKTSNEIAVILLKIDSKQDKKKMYRQKLFSFQRDPSEDLISAVTRFVNLVDAIYPVDQPNTAGLRDTMLKTAYLSFSPDEVAVPLLAEIRQKAEFCEIVTLDKIKEVTIEADAYLKSRIKSPLQYARTIGGTPHTAATGLQLNSMQTHRIGLPESEIVRRKKAQGYRNDMWCGYPDYRSPVFRDFDPYHIQGNQDQGPPMANPLNLPAGPQEPGMQNPDPDPQIPDVRVPPPNMPAPNVQEQQNILQPGVGNAEQAQAQAQDPEDEENEDFFGPDALMQAEAQIAALDLQAEQVQGIELRQQQDMHTPQRYLGGAIPRRQEAFVVEGRPTGRGLARTPPNTVPIIRYDQLREDEAMIPTMQGFSVMRNNTVHRVVGTPEHIVRQYMQQPGAQNLPARNLQFGEQSASAQTHPETPRVGRGPGFDKILASKTPDESLGRTRNKSGKSQESTPNVNSLELNSIQNYSGGRRGQSQERGRYPSRDRYSRPDSRDRKYESRYRSQSRDRQQGRQRPYSSDRGHRGQSKDRQSSNQPRSYSRDRYRDNSRGRDSRRDNYEKSRSSYYTRSSSGNWRGQSRPQSKNRGYDQRPSQNRSYSKSPGRPRSLSRESKGRHVQSQQNRPTSRTRGQSQPRSSSEERRKRDQSAQTRQTYGRMKKGVNCKLDYDPRKTKHCTKCRDYNSHHEFECPVYQNYNPQRCSQCEKYNHWPNECKECQKFPPKTGEVNSMMIEPPKNW